jgi:hypothetical protein
MEEPGASASSPGSSPYPALSLLPHRNRFLQQANTLADKRQLDEAIAAI